MSLSLRRLTFLAALSLLPAACGDSENPQPPGPAQDAGTGNERPDSGGTGNPDSGPPDSGTPDSGTPDSGTPDAGGSPDSGTPDSGTPDSGTPDGGADGGVRDAGPPPAFEGTPVVAHTTCGRTMPFFAASRSTGAGQPRSVAVADLNRDGRLDLAFARANEVTVLLGEGTGRFQPAVKYAGAALPQVILAADFNRDGAPDLVTAGYDDVAVLFLGNGDGTFTRSTTPPTGIRGDSLVARDFNRDGNLDIATHHSGGIAVVPGRGDGTFGAPIVTTVSPEGAALDAADMNGDGILDLGVTHSSNDHFTILLGRGDGTFPTQRRRDTFEFHSDIRLADFNGDGRMDALVGNQRESMAEVHIGSGTGAFSSVRQLDTQTFIGDVDVADVNGDGLPDAIARSNGSGADVYVFLSQSASAFEPEPLRYTTGDPNVHTVTGDINSDGMVDIFFAAQDANTFGFLYGNRGNILAAPRELVAGPNGTATMAALDVVDLDRDGRLDVVVADSLNHTLNRLRGQPDGGFSAPSTLSVGENPTAIAIGSLDDNLIPDIAVANAGSDSITIFRQDSAGSEVRNTYFVGQVPNDVAMADLNGDGRNDVVTANRASGTVTVLLNTGTGQLGSSAHFTAGSGANAVAAADFNRDDRTDLAVANRFAGTVVILRNNGMGGFTNVQRLFVPGQPYTVASGHFNEDSYLDLAVGTSLSIEVFLGSSSGFRVGPYQDLAVSVDQLVLADMNGDLLPDILATSALGRFVTLLAGRGDGTFAGPVNLGPRRSPGSVAAADLDGDGARELLTATLYGNRLHVSRNLGCGN